MHDSNKMSSNQQQQKQQKSSNEKKSLLVSISGSPNRPGGVSSGYDSLSTVATQMHLPLSTTTTSSLNNTLLGEQQRRQQKRPAPKFREPAPFENMG